MGQGSAYRAGPWASLALGVCAVAASAQVAEDEGGARAVAGFDIRLEVDNGDPELRTGFDLDLITATRTQRLGFSGDFGLTVPLDNIDAASMTDPRYGIDYLRDTGRSRFTFSADYSETDIASLRALEDDLETEFDESTLTISEDGSRERRQAAIGLVLGLNNPVGVDLRYSYDETLYTDVTDPDLEDRRRDAFSAGLRLDVDPTLSFNLNTLWRHTDTEGATPDEETRREVGLSASWQALPELRLTGSATYVNIVTDTIAMMVPSRTEQSGVNLGLGATLDRPNGSYRLNFSRNLSTLGYTNSVELGRDWELARGAEIDAQLGLVELPNGSVYPTAGLSYSRDTAPGGRLNLSLNRTAAINSDDDEVLRTVLRASYGADLAQGARWSLSGRLTDSDYVNGTEPDIASARLSASYSRPLTEDWDLSAGLSWQVTREDGAADDTDNRIFLSLERRFTFRR